MSQNRLPEVKDPLADLAIKPMEEIEEEHQEVEPIEEEPPVEPADVFGSKKFKKKNEKINKKVELEVKDEMKDNLPNSLQTIEEEPKMGRGKDKVKRKRKKMTASQLEALKRGREKSLAIRKAKAAEKKNKKKPAPTRMPPPQANAKLSYDDFSNYMDMYEEKRKKKHSTSKEPHPNRVINPRHRPIAPPSQPRQPPKRVAKWTGNIGSFAQHKTGGGRWNYGI